MTSIVLLVIVMASLMLISTASARYNHPRSRQIRITSHADGSLTEVVVNVEGIFRRHIPHPDERWWILVSPEDSNLVHPGAPVDFSYDRKWEGTWRGRHPIYLTGDPAQSQQPFRVMVAKVTPETHWLYVYRLQNEIYDYLEMQPDTIVYDYVIVERLL